LGHRIDQAEAVAHGIRRGVTKPHRAEDILETAAGLLPAAPA
jgi:hypothetical protein